MKCGVGGANYTKYGASRFACAGARDRATCANGITVRGDDVENAILDGLKSRLMEPALFEEFAREFIAEVNKSRSEASSIKAAMRRDLERIDRQLKRLVDVILEGGDAKTINVKLKELEAEKSRLTRELAMSPKEEPLLHPNLTMIYRSRVDALEALFRDAEEGREAFETRRGLIEQVRIIPEDGEYRLELKGELAGILALAQGAKNSEREPAQRALQIKVVAGAGFGRNHTPIEFLVAG
jgi:site-specific DNA recombinase